MSSTRSLLPMVLELSKKIVCTAVDRRTWSTTAPKSFTKSEKRLIKLTAKNLTLRLSGRSVVLALFNCYLVGDPNLTDDQLVMICTRALDDMSVDLRITDISLFAAKK